MISAIVGVVALVLLGQGAAGGQSGKLVSGFDEAWEAFSNQESGAVAAYKVDNASGARSIAMEILKQCIAGREDAKEILEQKFRIVVKILEKGNVERVFVRGLPEEESSCVIGIASEHSFSAPPKEPFYLGTAMEIRPR